MQERKTRLSYQACAVAFAGALGWDCVSRNRACGPGTVKRQRPKVSLARRWQHRFSWTLELGRALGVEAQLGDGGSGHRTAPSGGPLDSAFTVGSLLCWAWDAAMGQQAGPEECGTPLLGAGDWWEKQ